MAKRKPVCLFVILPVRCSGRLRRNSDKWKDYVRGEWWIDQYGEALFADQATGEAGHEMIAVDNMLNTDVLVDWLVEHFESMRGNKEDDWVDDRIEKVQDYRNREFAAAALYSEYDFPSDIGAAAAGGKERWQDLKKDPRMAYAKHEGAILVINLDFYAYKVTGETVKAIQAFVEEQIEGVELSDPKTELCVEQVEPHEFACMPVQEFLTIKHPRDLWGHA